MIQKYVVRKDSLIKVHVLVTNNDSLELINYSTLLKSLSEVSELKEVQKVLNFIDDDLSLKTDILRDSTLPAGDKGINVKVRVLDSSATREISGYDVFAKPEISLDPRLIETFNPTNNAIKEISPGRKVFWIEKDGKIIKRRIEGISITAQSPVVIDFTVK
ncbi:MAG: hypothetical protein QM764_07050 [Chitinophagaceae bacterium]